MNKFIKKSNKNLESQIKLCMKLGIDVPLYPFKVDAHCCDFTINSMHVDLHSIYDKKSNIISFDWHKKMLQC